MCRGQSDVDRASARRYNQSQLVELPFNLLLTSSCRSRVDRGISRRHPDRDLGAFVCASVIPKAALRGRFFGSAIVFVIRKTMLLHN